MKQVVARLGSGVVDDGFISADDLAVNRGDGCFDATLVRVDGAGPEADFVEEHLERLGNSARLLDMAAVDVAAWQELTTQSLVAWDRRGGGEAVMKFLYTRGQETSPGEPLGLITVTELNAERIASREAATAVTLSAGREAHALGDAPWLLGGAKTLSYGVNLSYVREAARRGATDPIMVTTDGYVLEGPQSGILVLKGDLLYSTPVTETGILDSITIRHALAGWREKGWPTEHRLYTVEELGSADAAWFASSIRGITPMIQLNDAEMRRRGDLTEVLRSLVRPKTGFGIR